MILNYNNFTWLKYWAIGRLLIGIGSGLLPLPPCSEPSKHVNNGSKIESPKTTKDQMKQRLVVAKFKIQRYLRLHGIEICPCWNQINKIKITF